MGLCRGRRHGDTSDFRISVLTRFDGEHFAHVVTDFFGGFVADVIELGAADFRAADHVNLINHRRIERIDALDTDAVNDFTDGEGGASFGAVLPRQNEAFEGLQAGLVFLADFLPNANSIPRVKVEVFAVKDVCGCGDGFGGHFIKLT